LDLRRFRDPASYLSVGCTGGDEVFELFGIDSSESEEGLIKRAVEMIGPGSSG
jgi:hypothetical protein